MPKKHVLMTTGYAGETTDSFVAKLRAHGVETIVDVRELPLSRKKGFSKTALADLLGEHNIEYVHRPQLGVPKSERHRLRANDVAIAEYFDEFRGRLTSYPEVLDEIHELALSSTSCLICVEENAEECHRSVVAESIVARGDGSITVKHI